MPYTCKPADRYVARLWLSAASCARHGVHLLPQKLRMTTSPRCSESRTLPPAIACNAKSGAACARSAYEVSANAGAQNATAASHSHDPKLDLVGQYRHKRRCIAPSGRCKLKKYPSANDATAARTAGRGEPSH